MLGTKYGKVLGVKAAIVLLAVLLEYRYQFFCCHFILNDEDSFDALKKYLPCVTYVSLAALGQFL